MADKLLLENGDFLQFEDGSGVLLLEETIPIVSGRHYIRAIDYYIPGLVVAETYVPGAVKAEGRSLS